MCKEGKERRGRRSDGNIEWQLQKARKRRENENKVARYH